jgi:hypothetical protein
MCEYVKKALIAAVLVVSTAFVPCLSNVTDFPDRTSELAHAAASPLFWQFWDELLSRELAQWTKTVSDDDQPSEWPRDTSFVLVSRAPLQNILPYKKRMGWAIPWFSSSENDFNVDFGVTKGKSESSGTSVFLRDGDHVFRTYFTTGRGDEMLGGIWAFLDLTPFGRQENWEDSPEGWPQTPPYQWWRRHDEYGA